MEQVFTSIGSTISIPAALLIFWLYLRTKELSTKVKQLEDALLNNNNTLNEIRTDVAYIKGRLEYNEVSYAKT